MSLIDMPDKAVVPPVGSELDIKGFKYRVHKITQKDMVLRPIGFADPKEVVEMTFFQRLRFLIHGK